MDHTTGRPTNAIRLLLEIDELLATGYQTKQPEVLLLVIIQRAIASWKADPTRYVRRGQLQVTPPSSSLQIAAGANPWEAALASLKAGEHSKAKKR